MMHSFSRREKLEAKFYELAEHGKFAIFNQPLYKSEIKRLKKHGFNITPAFESNKESPCTIDWTNPFPNGIPLMVHNYVLGIIQTFPRGLNMAQELYTLASKKSSGVREEREREF